MWQGRRWRAGRARPQGSGIVRRHEQAGDAVLNDLRHPTHRCGDDRDPLRVGLEWHLRENLRFARGHATTSAAARRGGVVARPEQLGALCPWRAIARPVVLNPRPGPTPSCAAHEGRRFGEDVVAPDWRQAADRKDEVVLGLHAESASRIAWREGAGALRSTRLSGAGPRRSSSA